jgi:hypothetical protein
MYQIPASVGAVSPHFGNPLNRGAMQSHLLPVDRVLFLSSDSRVASGIMNPESI